MKVVDWFVFQLLLQFLYTHRTSGSNSTFWPHGRHLSVHFRPEMEQVLSFLQYKLTKTTTPTLLPLAAPGFRSPDRNLGSQMLPFGEHRSIFTTPQSVGVGVQSARWQERLPAGSAEKFHTPTGSGPVSPETVGMQFLPGHMVTWLHSNLLYHVGPGCFQYGGWGDRRATYLKSNRWFGISCVHA